VLLLIFIAAVLAWSLCVLAISRLRKHTQNYSDEYLLPWGFKATRSGSGRKLSGQ
jgi:hypothetical protein